MSYRLSIITTIALFFAACTHDSDLLPGEILNEDLQTTELTSHLSYDYQVTGLWRIPQFIGTFDLYIFNAGPSKGPSFACEVFVNDALYETISFSPLGAGKIATAYLHVGPYVDAVRLRLNTPLPFADRDLSNNSFKLH